MKRRTLQRLLSVVVSLLLLLTVASQSVFAAEEGVNAEQMQLDDTQLDVYELEPSDTETSECISNNAPVDGDTAIFISIMRAINNVKGYSFQGTTKIDDGSNLTIAMKISGQVNLDPAYAQQLTSTMQMDGISIEQEMIILQDKVYIKNPAAGTWMTMDHLDASADQQNLAKYFTCETLDTVKEIMVNSKGDETEIDVKYDAQKYSDAVVKPTAPATTNSLEQHFVIDAATSLPKSLNIKMEFTEEEKTVKLEAEYTYIFDDQIKEISAPAGVN
jgi:hypothetical protein